MLFIFLGGIAYLAADNAPELKKAPSAAVPPGYILGPNDQISVDVVELPEFNNKSYRVDNDGTISLPLIGRVHAAGLTLTEFEGTVHNLLQKQVRNPHLVANLIETRSQAVSVMGAVNTPGIQQLQGTRNLFDVLAAAGGLKQEAGDVITITRQSDQGPLNLPQAVRDPASGRMTAELKVRDVVELRDPHLNIPIMPHDEISVPKAKLLYVIGNVRKAGGFTLSDGRSVSALEALSMAEGLAPNAGPSHARILRRNETSVADRQQIPIDLKKILDGKAEDVALMPDDILFVPDNLSRRVSTRALEMAVQTLSGIVIWRGI
ncbi:MAG TPA: polysaccharide biosynthesis/export family protein [Bryobacteraceae bacterium]|nr:polysaccharide biosynthesis/export family protein [Bryobacteraceae bacterium]